jgi:F0F1-type ATP synthase assembly protein I
MSAPNNPTPPRKHWRTDLEKGQVQSADILAYLLAGPLTFGGIGYLIDRWATLGIFLPLGVIGGLVLAIYVIRVRYGGD